MRVLLVGNFLRESTGVHNVCYDLRSELKSAGCGVWHTSEKASPVTRVADMVATALRLRGRVDVAQVDVFSGRAFLWAEAACAALNLAKTPYVLTLHGGNLPAFAERHDRRVKRLLASAQTITCPSQYLVTKMAHYSDALKLLPNPLWVDRYAFRHRTKPAPRLVWLRRIKSLYNPHMAVRALVDIRETHANASLLMAGPDADGLSHSVAELASSLGVRDAIDLAGAIPNEAVPNMLQRGDIFLNTSNMDNTPVSVLEAMACGLPILSTDAGGLPYMLQDETTALLSPADDHAAMAANALRVLDGGHLSGTLSRNGRQLVESSYSWSKAIQAWLQILEDAARAKRPR